MALPTRMLQAAVLAFLAPLLDALAAESLGRVAGAFLMGLLLAGAILVAGGGLRAAVARP